MRNIGFLFEEEDAYGHGKRLRFIKKSIEEYCQTNSKKKEEVRILDVGCGTGIGITFPLASLGYNIIGVDLDKNSIDLAKKENIYPNAIFEGGFLEKLPSLYDFDVIVCSEVLEHILDPKNFLLLLKSRLKPNGIIILTVPNGYGWFELEKFLYEKMGIGFLLTGLVKFKKTILFSGNSLSPTTLNKADRHLQRFIYKRLKSLFKESGLSVYKESGAGVFGGPISETFFGWCKVLLRFNNWLGDKVPAFLVIDWYFVLR